MTQVLSYHLSEWVYISQVSETSEIVLSDHLVFSKKVFFHTLFYFFKKSRQDCLFETVYLVQSSRPFVLWFQVLNLKYCWVYNRIQNRVAINGALLLMGWVRVIFFEDFESIFIRSCFEHPQFICFVHLLVWPSWWLLVYLESIKILDL